jgi:hypothetical protein
MSAGTIALAILFALCFAGIWLAAYADGAPTRIRRRRPGEHPYARHRDAARRREAAPSRGGPGR